MKAFIRFGEIPKTLKSGIWKNGIKIGEEIGVSVYDAVEMTDGWHAIMPLPISPSQGITYDYLVNNSKVVYLVTGNEIGIGSDNEPLLNNIRVIDDLTKYFLKL